MSCGSLLAKRRGLRGPIEWDDDIDFTVVFWHKEAFCEALEAMKDHRGQLEDAMGLKVLILGTNDRQVTVKVAPRLAPDATVSKQVLQRSRSYMLQSGAIFSAGLRSLSQQAVSVEFGRAGDRQRGLQNISLQVVDFNLVLGKQSDEGLVWRERPFGGTFKLPQDAVTEKCRYLGCEVPVLLREHTDSWLTVAYGSDFLTPNRRNLYGTVTARTASHELETVVERAVGISHSIGTSELSQFLWPRMRLSFPTRFGYVRSRTIFRISLRASTAFNARFLLTRVFSIDSLIY